MTDHQLMAAVREGNCDSLGVLFDRHHRNVYNYFLKHTGNRTASEDLTQDVFLRILKYRRTYEDQEGGFTVWLYRIARNVRFDYYRQKEPDARPVEEAELIPDNGPAPDMIDDIDDLGLVRRALGSLPDGERDLIVMSKYQGMKYKEIGAVVGCTEGAVKVRVFRALKLLAAEFHRLKGEGIHEL